MFGGQRHRTQLGAGRHAHLLARRGRLPDKIALQGATAVGTYGVVWRRSGTSTWTRQAAALTSVDGEDGNDGGIFNVTYRNGVLVATESGHFLASQKVFIEASPGRFEHVGSLRSYSAPVIHNYDVSNGVVVATASDLYGTGVTYQVHVFTLPTQLRVPAPVVNDFEDRDASDFTFSGGQFALATRGSDDVLAQGSTTGRAVATTQRHGLDRLSASGSRHHAQLRCHG